MSADTVCLDQYLLARQLPSPDGDMALLRRELVTLLDTRIKLLTAQATAAHARASRRHRDLAIPLDVNGFIAFKRSVIPHNEGILVPIIYSSTTVPFMGLVHKEPHKPFLCLLPTASDERAKLEAIDAVLGTDTYTLPEIYYALNPSQEELHRMGIYAIGVDNPYISRGIALNSSNINDVLGTGIPQYAQRMAKICHAHLLFEEKAHPQHMAQDLVHRAHDTLIAIRGH